MNVKMPKSRPLIIRSAFLRSIWDGCWSWSQSLHVFLIHLYRVYNIRYHQQYRSAWLSLTYYTYIHTHTSEWLKRPICADISLSDTVRPACQW